jgi:hypothetical protein
MTKASNFQTGDKVHYLGRMLPHLRDKTLVVARAHFASGIGDPDTDDCCLVHEIDHRGCWGPGEVRVSTSHLCAA